ncbi:MAG: NAD(P)-dependent oxidoreductase [Candidatus Bathyarchaeia archaeon]
MASRDTPVGFIGIGTMGLPMAKNILKAGYPLTVWNRTVQRTTRLIEMGAKLASNPAQLASESSVIITMLSDPQAVLEVVLGGVGSAPPVIEGVGPGKVLVDMSTNLPSVSRMIADKVHERGGEMLDAPVSGSVKPAIEGALTIMVGGRSETLERVKPVLETMGKRIFHVGGNGDGCSMKLALNMHLGTLMVSFAEAFTFGVKAGLDPRIMLEVFNNTVLRTYISETKGQKMIDGDWSTAFALSLMVKDLDLASDSARDMKIPIPLTSLVRDLYYACVANGKGGLDFSAVATQLEQMGNIKISGGVGSSP